MFRTLRPYFISLFCVWVTLCVAAFVIAQKSPYSHWIMTGVLPAFLVEAVFFVGAGFEQTRQAFARVKPPALQSAILLASAVIPNAIVTMTAGTFDSHGFLILLGLCAVVSFWYVVLPRRIAYDVGLLVILAAAMVLHVFPRLYVSPSANLHIEILGHLMWIRLALVVLLVQRDLDMGPVSFWPNRAEWREGLLQYALAIVPISLLACGVHFVRFAPRQFPAWEWTALAAGYFLGALWVVAFSEELFFRGVILRGILNWRGSAVLAVIVSTVVYGCAHLWYHDFPNWRFALIAAVVGCFYGAAYLRRGSIRAPMVAHALVVVTWRMLFVTS
ncbi:MAG TPA: type II CAAX endopeptidase family protein [Bryobacteraceae bacterium]|nr:type II CAAX endopeptidase family protein [Bryobacteraceae bacterium]